MDELIQTHENQDGQILVNGRELHEFLEVKTDYKDWFPRMVKYGFVENQDFSSILSESTGGRPKQDHVLTLAMAKEVSMIQRTEKGKAARKYFLKLEELWNSPEAVMKRALEYAKRQVEQLKMENKKMQSKALFADAVSASETSVLIGELAKILSQNGVKIGQNRLFEWLRENGYLIKRGESRNLPTQRSIELGIMEIKERTILDGDGDIRVTRSPRVTGKGQQYFVSKFL